MNAGLLALLAAGGYLLLARQPQPAAYGSGTRVAAQPNLVTDLMYRLGLSPEVTRAVAPAARSIVPAATAGVAAAGSSLVGALASGIRSLFGPSEASATPYEAAAPGSVPLIAYEEWAYGAPDPNGYGVPSPDYFFGDTNGVPSPDYFFGDTNEPVYVDAESDWSW